MEPEVAIADAPGASATKVATVYIIWIVRIALPIIFFWVWYRTQPEKHTWYSQPHEISRSRDELMQVRKSVANSAVPKTMSNLKVMPEAALPQSTTGRTASRGGKRDQQAKRTEEQTPTRAQRTEDPSFRAPRAEEYARALAEEQAAAALALVQPAGGNASSEQGSAKIGDGGASLPDKDRMHLQKLLNYVAFEHKDRPKRVFLPDGQPPVPRKPGDRPDADAAESARANTETRALLECVAGSPSFNFRPSDVSGALHRRLIESRVRVSEATLALMAESCANAGDLKGASEFLMKMEAAGHCPDSALLDKVMDLFHEEKDSQVVEPAEEPAAPAPKSHPWAAPAAKEEPHPHALNFGAYSEDEGE